MDAWVPWEPPLVCGRRRARSDVNQSFLQPFLAYNAAGGWTFGLNAESTCNLEARDWSVPINATVAKLVTFGKQPVQFTAGLRYWAETPANGPDALGGRVQITFLFPK